MISLQRRCKKRHQNQVFSIRGAYFWKIMPEVLFYGASGRIFMLFGVLPDSYDIGGNDKYETNVAQVKPSSPSCSLTPTKITRSSSCFISSMQFLVLSLVIIWFEETDILLLPLHHPDNLPHSFPSLLLRKQNPFCTHMPEFHSA